MDVWLQRLSDEMESAVAGMDARELEFCPAEGKWNAANILEHLARAFGGTAKGLEDRLAKDGGPSIPAPTVQQWIAIFAVTKLGYFPNGRKAPAGVEPTGASCEESLTRFRENLQRMDAALAEAAERWGAVRVAVHPVLGPLTVHQWRRFHYIHTHHHVKQMNVIRQQLALNGKAAF